VPIRDSAPPGAPVWIDLASSNPQLVKSFYAQLFGWTFEESGEEFGHYINFFKDGQHIAGLMQNQQPGAPDSWVTYLCSVDAKATADAVSAAGGQVIVPPMDIADLGTMAIATDPGGAVIGVWQPGEHKGYALAGEAGAPVWHELHTTAYTAVVPFYQQAFGWETNVMSDTDDFRYTVMVAGGTQLAGVMDAATFLPPAPRRTGRSTWAQRTSTPRSRRWLSSAGPSPRPQRTPLTAASRRPPTRPAPCSSSPHSRADLTRWLSPAP